MDKDERTINILEIPKDTGHWLLRADGGKYYEDFFLNNFVAISDNEINLHSIKKIEKRGFAGLTIEHIKELYNSRYPEWSNQKVAHAAGRTHRFYTKIKIGDLILVPSKRSTHFLLGIITSEVYEIKAEEITTDKEVNYPISNNLKRRNVSWIKTVDRKEISDRLYWILSAHQAIFNLEEDKNYINQLLSPIYIHNGNCHGTLKIEKSSGLNSDEWYKLHSIIKDYSDKSKDDVFIKSNVQSPGLIELVSSNPKTILSIIMVLGAGVIGEVSFFGFKFKGILPYIQSQRKAEIENEIMEEEKISKQIKNQRDKFELMKDKEAWTKQKETEEELRTQLQISSFDAGKAVGDQMQKDTLENPDLDEL